MSNIVRMANDIANFFEYFPVEEGTEMYAEHINKFWYKDLKRKLFEQANTDPTVLHSLVLLSLPKIRCAEYNPIEIKFKDKGGTGG